MIRNIKYNTKPLIVHNPYLGMSKYKTVWDHIEKIRLKKCTKPEDVTIVTWNNLKKPSVLEKQLNELEIEYDVLGKSIKWTSNRLKPALFLDHEFKTKYVIGLDAFDVKIIRDLSNVLDAFLKFDCKALYNATSTLYPYCVEHICEKDMGDGPFHFFNSGAFIGEVDFIKSMYATIDLEDKCFPNSDQYLIRKLYHSEYPKIKLDCNCKIFQIAGIFFPENIFDYVIPEEAYL